MDPAWLGDPSVLRDAIRGTAAPDSDAARFWKEYQAMGLYQEYTPGMNSSNRTMADIMSEQATEGRIKRALGNATNAKLRRAFNELGRNRDTALRVIDQWNGYFNALVYLNRQEQYPLQLILREILISSQMVQADIGDLDAIQEMQRIAATVKYGVIVVASVPMLMIYPLVQKYFVKGVMIGSVKG